MTVTDADRGFDDGFRRSSRRDESRSAPHVDDASSNPTPTPRRKRGNAAKSAMLAFVILICLETTVQRWINGTSEARGDLSPNNRSMIAQEHSPRHDVYAPYTISHTIRSEYGRWHKLVRNLSGMELRPPTWTPVVNWTNHPRERSDRFPSVDERVQYYMGKWFNASIPMYGADFEKATFIQRKTTREYGTFSDILVSLYNLDQGQLYKCYQNKKELRVMSPYCRDYIDVAILHSEGTAGVLHNIGDGLPYVPEEIRKYPLMAKVRPLCNPGSTDGVTSASEKKLRRQKKIVEPILLPLNRKRHFSVASTVPENDIPWEEKIGKAVWRGKYGKTHATLSDTNDIKYALVSKHLDSALFDAKFSKNTKHAPPSMIGSYMDARDQLAFKYLISIEGNDVSSGLKWMLFSNSVVLTPRLTWESWAMEGRLAPFEHFIPIKDDMSDVEEMVRWAEAHPEETRVISERSTLFVYDLLFHPSAVEDEREIMVKIMERFEQNFGAHEVMTRRRNSLNVLWDRHPPRRELRFPSVEERVKYAMGKWYHNDDGILMKRSDMKNHLPHSVSQDGPFAASGSRLSSCALGSGTYSNAVQALCRSSLPEFDERNTADLKSNSFDRLRRTKKGGAMRIAPSSSWRNDSKGEKESKRVLLDDSVKILCYGGDCTQEGRNVPFFASFRKNDGSTNKNAIIWPLGVNDAIDMVKSGWLETMDKDFEHKKPEAVWSDGFGCSQHTTDASNDISRKFFIIDDESKRKENISKMLSHRYLLAAEKENSINEDLLWMLLSQSIVLMPAERGLTSWLMEGFLKPYIHFVPVAPDHSDIDEKIRWCEDNIEEARMITERATLFVHDLLLGQGSERDNEEVKLGVMERYSKLYG